MIFGTDGIRARFGEAPLDEQTVKRLSTVIANDLRAGTVVVGQDTRASCDELKSWILAGLDEHFEIIDLGVVTTPMVAVESQGRKAVLGIMITASHNPGDFNGLKFFGKTGLKISAETASQWSSSIGSAAVTSVQRERVAGRIVEPVHYRHLLAKHFKPSDFKGMKIGFDLAQGSGSRYVASFCQEVGLSVVMIGDQPDGLNINLKSGALHPEGLAALVADQGLTMGVALDGDGDRAVIVDGHGQVVHGDRILYALWLCAREDGLHPTRFVGTVLCGLGLQQRLRQEGVTLLRTSVGDQNVMTTMLEEDVLFGGEPSGHLIQRDIFPAGDGLTAGLRLAQGLARNPGLLELAIKNVPIYPTIEVNVPVCRKPPWEEVPSINRGLKKLEDELGNSGRVIMRYSGTEPLLRLFIEGKALGSIETLVEELIGRIRKELS